MPLETGGRDAGSPRPPATHLSYQGGWYPHRLFGRGGEQQQEYDGGSEIFDDAMEDNFTSRKVVQSEFLSINPTRCTALKLGKRPASLAERDHLAVPYQPCGHNARRVFTLARTVPAGGESRAM